MPLQISNTHTAHVLYPLSMALLVLLHLGHVRYHSDYIATVVSGDPCQGLGVYGPASGISLILNPHIPLVCDAMDHPHFV